MKCAILNKKNGSVKVEDIPIPELGSGDVLVKIHYAGVNPLDNMIVREEVKLITPYKYPLIMGNEFSGVVEKVGSGVSKFKKGDKVYARMPLDKIGAFAEYTAINHNELAHVPDYLNLDEAACIPLTALTAMQAFQLMNVSKNEKIFISGGTGSLGAIAIPIAKNLGLYIITNGNGKNKDNIIDLGADEFIDYKTQDYSEILTNVDYVLDTLGDREIEKEFKILKNGGTLVSLKGLPNGEFADRMGLSVFKKMLFKIAGRKYDKMAGKKNQKYYFLFVESNGNQLNEISKIFSKKQIRPLIDEVFDLDEVEKALKKVDNGGSKGKTLLKII